MSGSSKLRRLNHIDLQVVKVEAQARIRIGPSIRVALSWLEKATVDCVMELGSDGGVVLATRAALSPMDEDPRALSQEGEPDRELLRYLASLAMSWELPLQYGASRDRYTLHLPEEARDLEILPQAGERAVVFAAQDKLQVWPKGEWLTYVRDAQAGRATLREYANRLASFED